MFAEFFFSSFLVHERRMRAPSGNRDPEADDRSLSTTNRVPLLHPLTGCCCWSPCVRAFLPFHAAKSNFVVGFDYLRKLYRGYMFLYVFEIFRMFLILFAWIAWIMPFLQVIHNDKLKLKFFASFTMKSSRSSSSFALKTCHCEPQNLSSSLCANLSL